MKPKSHTLFHFTKSREALLSILSHGFWPKYCLEDMRWMGENGPVHVAIPMACFCDIPLSRIDEHILFYGEYGIGLTKDWAVTNGLNPVLYIASDNMLSKSLLSIIDIAKSNNKDKQEENYKTVRKLASFTKPTEGTMIVAESPTKKEFYQESEWRFIPQSSDVLEYLQHTSYQDDSKKSAANEATRKHCMLQFGPKDVKYIFVKSDSDIPTVINHIQTQMDMHPNADVKILMSRVVSLESIRHDL